MGIGDNILQNIVGCNYSFMFHISDSGTHNQHSVSGQNVVEVRARLGNLSHTLCDVIAYPCHRFNVDLASIHP